MFKIGGVFIVVFILGMLFSFDYGVAQTPPDLRVQEPFEAGDLPLFAQGQLIVKFKAGQSQTDIEVLKNTHGASEMRRSQLGGFVTLRFASSTDILGKAEIFEKNPLVEYAHPNYLRQNHFVPNDEFYNFQWHFDDDNTNNPGTTTSNPFGGANGGGIGMEQAWNISTGDSSVVVAVLDSGVAYEDFTDTEFAQCYNRFGQLRRCQGLRIDEYFQAPDLANTNFLILPDSDFVNSDSHPNDDRNHGTHVAGTIAQSTDNTTGVAGMAYNTTIMPVKVLDASGSGFDDVIAEAILFAALNGADVISMSFGGEGASQVLEDAVASAFDDGVVLVASAGNSFTSGNPVNYPAAYDAYVIAVGATRYDETRSPFSSTGSYVDVAAPGGDTSQDQNDDTFADGVLQQTFTTNDPSDFAYFFFQGTSMSAPHVSALAALILSVDNTLTPTEVRYVIESTAEDKGAAGRDDEYGHGIIDASAALLSLIPSVSIELTTDGAVAFSTLPLNTTLDTTASGTDDVQTISVAVGPVNLDVKSTSFSGGGNTWDLAGASGVDEVKWEFSPDGSSWTTFSSPNTLFSLATSVAESSTQNMYLRITTPTDNSSSAEHSSTVTIVASSP